MTIPFGSSRATWRHARTVAPSRSCAPSRRWSTSSSPTGGRKSPAKIGDAPVTVVLDASALLAYWLDEPGADVVTARVGGEGASISAANFAEAVTKLVDRRPQLATELPNLPGRMPHDVAASLPGLPLAGGAISVEPFTIADALSCAKLRPETRQFGLSLGDRACLVLGQRMSAPVLTADRSWSSLSVEVEVVIIR